MRARPLHGAALESIGNGDPSGRTPGLYVGGRRIWGDVGDPIEWYQIAALGKDALTVLLEKEFSVRVEGGGMCCPECGVRRHERGAEHSEHQLHCASGAICQRVRNTRVRDDAREARLRASPA